jgi:hypothetical protein
VYTHIVSPIYATCPAHVILDLITQIIFGNEHRSQSSLLRSLHSPVSCLPSKAHMSSSL